MKIIVSGGWSYGNVGDEAIATASISLCSSFFRDNYIIYTAYSPESFQECHHICADKSVHRLLEDANCSNDYEEIINHPEENGLSAFVDMLQQGDIFIMSGGGYFVESSKSLQFLSRLVEIELAKSAGCKIVLIGQSIGPILSEIDRKRVSHALDYCTRIYVRDQSTLEYLHFLNNKVDVRFAPDLAVIIPDIFEKEKLCLSDNKDNIISVMPAHYSLYQRVNQKEKLPRLCETILRKLSPSSINYRIQLRKLIRKLSHHYKIRFVMSTNWAWDQSFATSITKGIDNDCYEFVTCTSTEELIKSLITTKCLISTKMHPLIIASSYNIPTIGISYNYKVDNYMRMIHREAYCYRIDNINADKMLEQVECIVNEPADSNGQTFRKKVYEMMADIKSVTEKE